MNNISFSQLDKYSDKAVSDLLSLGSDPAMAGFVSGLMFLPIVNFYFAVKLLEGMSGKDLLRELADGIETQLASAQVDATNIAAEKHGQTVADGYELALESYRAFLRDLKTGSS